MNIRKATLKDAQSMIKLSQESFQHGVQFDKTLNVDWPANHQEHYREILSGRDVITFVAESENKMVGYLVGRIIKAETWRKNIKKIAELENMFILEQYRGKGIGKELIKRFMLWAKENKIKRLKVVASSGNTLAINVYKKAGFDESAIILERDL